MSDGKLNKRSKQIKSTRQLAGMKFGSLLVISYSGMKPGVGAQWLCRCECGAEKIIWSCSLITGNTKSCGCRRSEFIKSAITTHGNTVGRKTTPEFRSYWLMRNRCYRQKDRYFSDYGGRGIKVCDEWLGEGGFERFLKHVGPKPSRSHSIDRIDVNGNYEPENVKWSTPIEQARNRRRTIRVFFEGQERLLCELAEEKGMHHSTVSRRIRNGWTLERALETPVKRLVSGTE